MEKLFAIEVAGYAEEGKAYAVMITDNETGKRAYFSAPVKDGLIHVDFESLEFE